MCLGSKQNSPQINKSTHKFTKITKTLKLEFVDL